MDTNEGKPGAHENGNGTVRKGLDYFMNTRNWWGPLTFILIISLAGVGMIGFQRPAKPARRWRD